MNRRRLLSRRLGVADDVGARRHGAADAGDALGLELAGVADPRHLPRRRGGDQGVVDSGEGAELAEADRAALQRLLLGVGRARPVAAPPMRGRLRRESERPMRLELVIVGEQPRASLRVEAGFVRRQHSVELRRGVRGGAP